MKIRELLVAVGLVALLLPGCAVTPKKAAVLAQDFGSSGVHRVEVAPVLFADEPFDWYFGERVAAELQRETVRMLESRGYEATSAGAALVRHPPPGPLAELAPPVPAAADAVLVVRFDHFLDAGLQGGDRFINTWLEIYATAALVDKTGKVLWQDSGVGRSSRSGTAGYDPLAPFVTATDLASSLLATLPAAPSRPAR